MPNLTDTRALFLILGVTAIAAALVVAVVIGYPESLQSATRAPLTEDAQPQPKLSAASTAEELGRLLFYDGRLSGDGSTSCATCHQPNSAFTDGKALSDGYSSGNLYFRNTPTLLNASRMPLYDWDGRFAQGDLATVVRDHIAEAHFMNMDGRLLVERMRQVPEYEQAFVDIFGSEVSYGRVLNTIATYLQTLESTDENPYVGVINGDDSGLNQQARRGLALFEGKAGCVQCHSGDLLSDGDFHAIGVPQNDAIFAEPKRHITFRRFFRGFGVSEFATMRDDPGLFALTLDEADRGKFRTPSLLEVAQTGPYMHNGVFETLEVVVEFYNTGGGDSPNTDSALRPLGLSDDEVADLVAFLESLQSPLTQEAEPDLPAYQPRTLGAN